MTSRNRWDTVTFIAAAAFNLSAAALLLWRPELTLARLGIADLSAKLLARSLASSAAAWGIGYALLALNPKRFREFAWLGALSKTFFALIYAVAYLSGQIHFSAFAPALVEILFAWLFIRYLRRTPDKPVEPQ